MTDCKRDLRPKDIMLDMFRALTNNMKNYYPRLTQLDNDSNFGLKIINSITMEHVACDMTLPQNV